MSDFTCPQCTARNQNVRSVGCSACGFGKPRTHEEKAQPAQKPKIEAPPGFAGGLLTEDL
jgi:ribosomal protein L37E